LTEEESVHLSQWPKISQNSEFKSQKLEKDMETVRQIVEVGHRARKENKLKVRQPLAKATVSLPVDLTHEYLDLIKKELNVKEIEIELLKDSDLKVVFDTKLSPELILEGKVRGLIREIQGARKELGKKPDELIKLTVSEEYKDYADYLKKRVMAASIEFGKEVKVE